jgi:alpha-glucosidase
VLREAVVIQMTWTGAPGIYYGDEAGLCGFTDPDNRRTYPWGREDFELIEFHCDMAWIHRKYRCLQVGALKPLLAGQELISYGRFTGDERIVVVVNSGSEERELTVPVWEIGVRPGGRMVRLMQTGRDRYNVGRKKFDVSADGTLHLRLHPVTAAVYLDISDEAEEA